MTQRLSTNEDCGRSSLDRRSALVSPFDRTPCTPSERKLGELLTRHRRPFVYTPPITLHIHRLCAHPCREAIGIKAPGERATFTAKEIRHFSLKFTFPEGRAHSYKKINSEIRIFQNEIRKAFVRNEIMLHKTYSTFIQATRFRLSANDSKSL